MSNSSESELVNMTNSPISPTSEKGSVTVNVSPSSRRRSPMREHPTEEEIRTLRRVSDKIPWTAYTIAFVELCERFSYYGTTAVCM